MKRLTTKEILAQSFLELSEKKRIDKITITEITDNCDLSQPTFYNHFRDKYDLIIWIYVGDARKFTDKIGVDGYRWRDSLADAAAYYAEKRNFVINQTGSRVFILFIPVLTALWKAVFCILT